MALANIQPSEPTVWVTPFAGPVLPEVKKMAAGASGDICGKLAAAPSRGEALKAQAARALGTKGDDAERQLAGLGRGKIGDPLGMSEDDARAADGKRMIDLRRRIAVIERRQHEPRFEAGEVVGEERDAVRHQRREAISGLQPKGEVVCGEPVRHRFELGPGRIALAREQGGLVRAQLKPDLEQLGERNGLIKRKVPNAA